jgi:hypothetical protein
MGKTVVLKRGLASTIEEWLMSAEYIMSEGNERIILCERGIRTFEPYTRNTLDLSAIPVLKKLTHLPVLIDPSHATGIREKVSPMARAAIAAGADALMIEVHHDPDHALSDGPQSLYPKQFGQLTRDIYVIAPVVGKQLDFDYLDKAAIGSKEAADLYGMDVIQEGIETNPMNFTRFAVIAATAGDKKTARKSSLVYSVGNQPGALYETLKIFQENRINLVKLESRPIHGRPWQYMFYADLEADVRSAKFSPVLDELKSKTDFLKVIGSY